LYLETQELSEWSHQFKHHCIISLLTIGERTYTLVANEKESTSHHTHTNCN